MTWAESDVTRAEQLRMGRRADREQAAGELGRGAIVGFGFGNMYALATRPDLATMRATNRAKGRPAHQPGSLTTTPSRLTDVWDLGALTGELSPETVHAVVDALMVIGPFGFRGPAADAVPDHLTVIDGGRRTAQLIVPGYACPSNDFIARALRVTHSGFLNVTSANRSRHHTGATDEPAHFLGPALLAEFADEPSFRLLAHDDDAAAVARYPGLLPMSTSVLALHRCAPAPDGRPTLTLERHGSLPIDSIRQALAPLGLRVALGPAAAQRLTPRTYRSHPA